MRTVILLLLSLVIGLESTQAFCGFYVARGDTTLFNKASKVVLVRDGDRTVLTMANDFKGDFQEFAIVIPVPTKLEKSQIHVTESKYIEHLDAYSAPRLVEYFDSDPCAPQVMYEMLAGSPAGAQRSKVPSPRADALGVKIEAEYTVGEYDIVILSAEQSNGLQTWLNESGYKIPKGAEAVLQSYILQGNKFFVAKVNLKEQGKLGYTYLRPIQIAFESPKFMLPIRLGTVNSEGTQDLFVFALTKKGRIETTNYRSVKIQEGLDIPLYIKDDFGTFYKSVFDESVRKEDMRAVFLEYAWDMGWCDPCASEPLSNEELRELGVFWVAASKNSRMPQGLIAPQPQNVFLTRLHVRYDAAHFPEDLTFQETSDRQNFQAKYVLRHRFTGGERCAARDEYDRSLPQRAETEAQNLVRLTGWNIEEVRKKIGAVKTADSSSGPKWWESLW